MVRHTHILLGSRVKMLANSYAQECINDSTVLTQSPRYKRQNGAYKCCGVHWINHSSPDGVRDHRNHIGLQKLKALCCQTPKTEIVALISLFRSTEFYWRIIPNKAVTSFTLHRHVCRLPMKWNTSVWLKLREKLFFCWDTSTLRSIEDPFCFVCNCVTVDDVATFIHQICMSRNSRVRTVLGDLLVITLLYSPVHTRLGRIVHWL